MIRIPKPGDDDQLYEKMLGRFGGAGTDFILELAEEVNRLGALIPVNFSYTVNPQEDRDGGKAQGDGEIQGLSRSEPGK